MGTPTTIVNYVYEKLREGIISGHYPAGARLNESQLAREFDISRIPVREALLRLRENGLVMKHDRRGMFVTKMSTEEAQHINSVRIILEAEALRLCQRNMNKKQAARLSSLVDRMEKWSDGSEVDAAALDIEFHRGLWEASGNPRLYEILDSLSTALFAHAAIQHATTETIKWRLNHHRSLLDVAMGQSSTPPEQAVMNHLKAYYEEPEKFSSLVKTNSVESARKTSTSSRPSQSL